MNYSKIDVLKKQPNGAAALEKSHFGIEQKPGYLSFSGGNAAFHSPFLR
jgi:hypothetical protein